MISESNPLTLLELFEESLLESLPEDYMKAVEHLINARIEFLNALKTLLEKRIAHMENYRERIRRTAKTYKKEKVPVE